VGARCGGGAIGGGDAASSATANARSGHQVKR
jgi:hypothetical protein